MNPIYFTRKSDKNGFSIVELLISMLIALIMIAVVMTIYVATIKNSRSLLNSASLSQELTAVMSILLDDIRRSGSYGGVTQSQLIKNNPFYSLHQTSEEGAPAIYRLPYGINISATQDCISFTYDADNDTQLSVEKNDIFAFRLKNKTIQTLQYPNLTQFAMDGCANNAGSWMNITDIELIAISQLHISTINSQCINMNTLKQWKTDSDSHLFPCLSDSSNYSSGDRLVELRHLTIEIKAQLSADSSVIKQLKQSIQIRNNVLVTIP